MKPLTWLVMALVAAIGLSCTSQAEAGMKHKAKKPKFAVSGPPPKKHQLFHGHGGHKLRH
jgi:hypothetical protein